MQTCVIALVIEGVVEIICIYFALCVNQVKCIKKVEGESSARVKPRARKPVETKQLDRIGSCSQAATKQDFDTMNSRRVNDGKVIDAGGGLRTNVAIMA